jgi:ketosteroid isomerase-like protein
MSQEDVDLVRRAYDSFNEGSVRDLVELWHEDAEMRPAFIGGGLVEGAVYRGREGILEFVSVQAETWQRVTLAPAKVRDLGLCVLVETHIEAIGRGSGIVLTEVTWNVWETRHGKLRSCRVFTDRAAALESLGLRE